MSHLASIYTTDGNLLFNEATGSSTFNKIDDLNFYDTDTGKWYRSVFDIEQAFYASNFYFSPEIDSIPEYEDLSFNFETVEMTFKPREMDTDSLFASVTPTLQQRVDGVYIVGYNVMPSLVNVYSLAVDDIF